MGSASVLTNASGGTVAGADTRYYPFGEARFSTSAMITDKLFTGQRQIAELGIYHYGARFYSPKLGRFLSADTIIPSYANPQSLNRFSYVGNNPLRYIDPTGHRRCESDSDSCESEKQVTKRYKSNQEKIKERSRKNKEKQKEKSGGGGQPLLSPNPDSPTLCPGNAISCSEGEFTETQLGAVEARLSNKATAEYTAAAVLTAISLGAAYLTIGATGSIIGIPAAPFFGVVSLVAGVAAAGFALHASQTSEAAGYVGEAKNYAKENGSVKMAYYQAEGDLVPSVVHGGDTDGFANGITSITAWLEMEHLFQ